MNPFDPINNDLEEYIQKHTSQEDDVLYELNRFTNLTTFHPRMLSGHVQGKLLELLCRMLNPKLVLEIGTFTGYSSICIARGISDESHLHTVEVDDEICDTAKNFFRKAKVDHKITLHIGNAIDIVPTLNLKFDLILIDGDKREYPQYLNAALPQLNVGGFLIADNVLWGGKVLDKSANDPFTQGVKDFNLLVMSDKRLEQVLLPLRDGLMIALKIGD